MRKLALSGYAGACALAPLFLLSGCTFSDLNAHRPGGRAFIATFRPPGDDGKHLRLAVKDNIDVQGVVTTAGSKYLAKNSPPAATDAPCLKIARERNVQLVGKTNLSEFAVSPSGVNEYFGTPRNPYCFWSKRIPGGSSSGSAVAVASGAADVAFGTDTAGSIRVPAACCGIVGLKTTHGLVSTKGVFPIEPEHLDTVGPMGKDVASTVVGMDLLQRGFLAKYAAAKAAQPTAPSIRVGRLKLRGTDPKIDASIDQALAKAGFQVVPLSEALTESWARAKEDGNAVAAAGAWISGKDYRSKPGIALRTKVVILAGQLSYATKYRSALARRAQWQQELEQELRKVDVIAVPTLQHVPNRMLIAFDAGLLEAQVLQLQNTVPVNFAGNPAVALPVPIKGELHWLTSLQFIGPKNSEARLLNAGRILEAAVRPSKRGTSHARLSSACPDTQAARSLRD